MKEELYIKKLCACGCGKMFTLKTEKCGQKKGGFVFLDMFRESRSNDPHADEETGGGVKRQMFFKEGFLEYVKKVKGIKYNRQLASLMGITEAYLSMLQSRKRHVTEDVIIAMAELLGNLKGSWETPFEIVAVGTKKPGNHPENNYKKMYGTKPYGKYSIAKIFRSRDQVFSESS